MGVLYFFILSLTLTWVNLSGASKMIDDALDSHGTRTFSDSVSWLTGLWSIGEDLVGLTVIPALIHSSQLHSIRTVPRYSCVFECDLLSIASCRLESASHGKVFGRVSNSVLDVAPFSHGIVGVSNAAVAIRAEHTTLSDVVGRELRHSSSVEMDVREEQTRLDSYKADLHQHEHKDAAHIHPGNTA